MGWLIQCPKCKQSSWAINIVDLIDNHTNAEGWFVCNHCADLSYIEKTFNLQEPGHTWKPYLRGVLRLGDPEDTYQPFVFIVSYEPKEKANDIWFSYYKDLRQTGGRLKLGHGPGGPPVLEKEQLLLLLRRLVELGVIEKEEIKDVIANRIKSDR